MEPVRLGAGYLLALFLAAAFFSACATTRSVETDRRIVNTIRDSYVFKTYLRNDNITVQSEGGKVTLTGTVPEESHRVLAQETATDTPGVKNVDNRLQVEGGAPREGSDAWLGAKVKAELLMHKNVNAEKTGVFVQDGIVTLRGQAENQAQKDLTAEYVKDVEGVKGVINEMTVAGTGAAPQTLGQAVDDASITAQVKLTLLTHRSTSGLNTQVDTSNGVVTVKGLASNQAEKDLVTKLITDINGVRGVNNQMIVETPASFTP